MKKFLKKAILLVTELLSPLTLFSAIWLKIVRRFGFGKIGNFIFMKTGILPVPDHYYQPLINPKKHLSKSLREDRNLPGIDLNAEQQLSLLSKFNYNEELLKFPLNKKREIEYYYNNGAFASGDVEYFYQIIRHFKPSRIIELGSGLSTLMATNAISQNKMENSAYTCNHICIEPYEMPWLEKLDLEVVREKVENLDFSFFQTLGLNDILFIDSSHIIRPQGDVLFEYLQILPSLQSGVLIHVHDIFTPRDYLNKWILEEHHLWNEQYLLEAFLTFNSKFKVIGALNFLKHHHNLALDEKCPILSQQSDREPGSFWMMKT